MKKLLCLSVVLIFALSAHAADAKGGGGGRSGGGARSSASRSASSRSTPRPSAPSKPTAPKVSSRPSTATKTVTAPKAKTAGGKTYSRRGNVVDENYRPRFIGGYAPAPGATVYYRGNGIMGWLPFYLIMTNQQHRQAIVTEPGANGAAPTERVVQEEGTDTMYVINWIVTLLFLGGVIAGIVWLVNRYSQNKR